MDSTISFSFKCECGRVFKKEIGLKTHKRYCGNYKTWFHCGYEMMTGDDGIPIEVHRYIMEKKIGRKLKSDELVHHKDEIKTNNDPDNLELTTRPLHTKHHSKKYFDNISKEEFDRIKQLNSETNKKTFIDSGYKNTSTLNKDQVLKIKEKLNNGKTGVSIAKEFNVSSTTIYNIRDGKTWYWIK